jgi:hypothetical protein
MIGFIFALIGLVFLLYFSITINWKILLADEHEFTRARAVITAINETQYTVNDVSLFEYHYRYSTGEAQMHLGSFLEYEGLYRAGQEIQVEYLNSSPEVSKFSGRDRRNLDQIMFLAGLGGTLTGFLFLVPSIRKTRRERKILTSGRPAMGTLLHAEPTNMKVNEQTVFKLTFEFSTDRNQSQQFTIKSHMLRNLTEGQSRMLVYDPRQPSNAVIVETLPDPVARYVSKVLELS